MKFTCSREKLLGGLQIVGSVVSTRGMKPVYESVLIRSRDGRLELQGTDLEVAIRFALEDEKLLIEEHGALVVPAQRLTAILREVKDEEIGFTWEGDRLSVDCLGSSFRVNGFPPEEFPEIPDFPEEAAVSVPSGLFKAMVARTAFATAKEKMRYALNGVLFLLEKDKVRMVGTDGRRLAYAEGKLENPTGAEIRAIIPTKGITQMSKVLSVGDETIELALKENQLAARTSNSVVVSRLVEGTFPKFEEVIPVNCENRATLSREAFVSAIRKAALLTSRESQSVRFSLSENQLRLTARAAEVGEANVTMEIGYTGAATDIAFNPAYVLEGLAAMTGETVNFEFRNAQSPTKLTEGEEFIYVVMPIHIE